MTGVMDMLNTLGEVAKTASKLLGANVEGAVELGEQVVRLVDQASELAVGNVPGGLLETRDALEKRVNAHVDDTVRRLRGDQ